jgi:LysR family transcriptional regulator, glycine cleavage system transcriptional activator
MTESFSQLPSLNALKVFDAVARQGSMAKAASEQNITPSAVTHHLHKLEEFLGVKLLTRTPNSIALTPEGQHYFEAIRPAFDILAAATADLMQREFDEPLRISCVPTLGNSWLATQLATLEQRLPGVSIQCDFSPVLINFDRDLVDLAIRYGSGEYPDADSDLLFIDKVAPVCTPETAQLIRTADDLLNITRLPSPETTPEGQSMWYYWANACYDAAFARKADVSGGAMLKSTRFTVEALKVSQCVAIIDYATASKDIRLGRLVSPLGKWIDAPYGYYILTPKRRSQRDATRQLKTLLKRAVHMLIPPETVMSAPRKRGNEDIEDHS